MPIESRRENRAQTILTEANPLWSTCLQYISTKSKKCTSWEEGGGRRKSRVGILSPSQTQSPYLNSLYWPCKYFVVQILSQSQSVYVKTIFTDNGPVWQPIKSKGHCFLKRWQCENLKSIMWNNQQRGWEEKCPVQPGQPFFLPLLKKAVFKSLLPLKHLLKCYFKKSSKRHFIPYLCAEFFQLSNQLLRLQGNKRADSFIKSESKTVYLFFFLKRHHFYNKNKLGYHYSFIKKSFFF